MHRNTNFAFCTLLCFPQVGSVADILIVSTTSRDPHVHSIVGTHCVVSRPHAYFNVFYLLIVHRYTVHMYMCYCIGLYEISMCLVATTGNS